MAEYAQKPKPTVSKTDAEDLAAQDAEVQAAQAKPAADLDSIDDLLDEIDGVLSEEVEFLAAFKQRGGE